MKCPESLFNALIDGIWQTASGIWVTTMIISNEGQKDSSLFAVTGAATFILVLRFKLFSELL
jgi:hypothetical protein